MTFATTNTMSLAAAKTLRASCFASVEAMAISRKHPNFRVGERVWILVPGGVEEAVVRDEGRPCARGGLEYRIQWQAGSGVWSGRDLIRKAA